MRLGVGLAPAARFLVSPNGVAGIRNPRDLEACAVASGDDGVGGTLTRLRAGTRDTMTIALKPVAMFVAHGLKLIPNDGVVTVAAARWGRFRGCMLADHMGEVGQGTDAGRADARTGFNVYVQYAAIARELVLEHQRD